MLKSYTLSIKDVINREVNKSSTFKKSIKESLLKLITTKDMHQI